MKNRLVFAIIIGFTALIFTMVMFTQFKTVDQTDISAIETMREAELRAELSESKTKYKEIETKLEEVNSKIKEYESKIQSNEDASNLLIKEVSEAETYLGYTDLEGEGIVITLEDNEYKSIESFDIITLINELKIAGAEAIEINGQRIISYSEIVDVNGKILINTTRISGPYIVKAIGDKKYLESAITIKGGYKDELELNEKRIEYVLSDEVQIPAYDGALALKYAEINEKEEEQ